MSKNLFKRRKPTYVYTVGGGAFKLEFYTDEKRARLNYLHITTPSGAFEQKVTGYPFGYLLAAAGQGKRKELEAYCIMLYRVSDEIYQDNDFAFDIINALHSRDERLSKEAEARAEAVTEEEEAANQAYMEDIVAYADADEQTREAMRTEDGEILREILEGQGEKED